MYRIRDWHEIFENNRSRELKKMDWVPIPNRMDGGGYVELVDHPNGAAHFGAWLAIVEIASRQRERGTLPQLPAGIPHSDEELSRHLSKISRLSAMVFLELLPRLLDPHIGWIERFEPSAKLNQQFKPQNKGIPQLGAGIPQFGAVIPQLGAALHARTQAYSPKEEKEDIEEKNTPPTPSVKMLQEVSDAFDRHQCFSNREPKDLIVQNVLSMNGKFDWEKFRLNHSPFCDFWSEKGWNFCKLSFNGWINAGMPGAPAMRGKRGNVIRPPLADIDPGEADRIIRETDAKLAQELTRK